MVDKKEGDLSINIPIGSVLGKVRHNPWIAVSVVLAIILIVVLAMGVRGGDKVSEKKAGENLISFIEAQGSSASLVSTSREGQLYKVDANVDGQDVSVYVTLDGKYAVVSPIPLDGGAVPVDNTAKPSERVNVEVGNSPSLGSATAKVTMVEFSDYECPFCGRHYSQTYSQLKTNYFDTGKVRFFFKDFPLSFHPNAQKSAEAARCVRDQKGDAGYFTMHDKMFTNQESLSVDNYKKWAREIVGINAALFDSCLDTGKFADAVKADAAYGQQVGVSGTPGFLINGRLISGACPYATFEQVFQAEFDSKEWSVNNCQVSVN